MAVSIVGRALLRIGKNAVGFRRFLELLLRRMVARIAVRMILHRQLAVGALQFLLARAAVNAEHFVIIAFRHRHFYSYRTCWRSGAHRDLTMEGRSSLPLKLYPRWNSPRIVSSSAHRSFPRAPRPDGDADRTSYPLVSIGSKPSFFSVSIMRL